MKTFRDGEQLFLTVSNDAYQSKKGEQKEIQFYLKDTFDAPKVGDEIKGRTKSGDTNWSTYDIISIDELSSKMSSHKRYKAVVTHTYRE